MLEAHAALTARVLESASFEWVGNVEGTDLTSGRADVIVTDGFTGNVTLKVMEGVSQTMLGAVRDAAMSSRRSKAGGMLLRPALRDFRDGLDPEGAGGAYLLGLRRLGVVPHGRFTRYGISRAILLAARGVSGELVGAHACGAGGGRCAEVLADVRAGLYGPAVMTREEVFSLIQAHLADELEVDPARIDEPTRFKEDLEADSLDLYTLVQELEDSYGVKIGDDRRSAHPHRGPGRRFRRRPRPVRLIATTEITAGRPSGRPASAGLHACLVDRQARRQLHAAGLPGRLGAGPGDHHAPVPAPGGRALRGGPADEDPRADGVGGRRAGRSPSA